MISVCSKIFRSSLKLNLHDNEMSRPRLRHDVMESRLLLAVIYGAGVGV